MSTRSIVTTGIQHRLKSTTITKMVRGTLTSSKFTFSYWIAMEMKIAIVVANCCKDSKVT